ncbi:MAG TPA: adenosylcobinamide-GDP ribazoletransferase [Puia sp.]|nr:adenosylcobinamide-GDP ribazoletransferase [Puia sp.]
MKKEWKIFLTAIMYFTRIRVPATIDHSPVYLQKSPKYFPIVGWIVGGICSLVFLVFAKFISADIGIAASMITGLLTTGAFHEDGFADVCDGFGGGWTKEKILLIMKDSRIGAFGAIGLLGILSSKFLLLKELPAFTPELDHPTSLIFYNYRYFILGVIGAHSLSRLMPVFVIQWRENVTDNEHSKSKPVTGRKLTVAEMVLAVILALVPFVFLPWPFLGVILPMLYTTYALSKYFKKWIGGYTGDCLGAIQQVTEIVFYLGFVIIWRYLM